MKNSKIGRGCYTEEYKDRAIALAKEFGPAEAAKLAGVTTRTIHIWYKKKYGSTVTGREWKPYSEDEKSEAIKYALSTSISEAAEHMGICRDTISSWIKSDESAYNEALEKGLIRKMGPRHSNEQIQAGLYLIKRGHKRREAARLVGVAVKTLEYWLRYKDCSLGNHRSYHNINKDEVIKYAKETKISEASKKYNIPYSTIWNWINRRRKGGIL